jgi:hypothetical protein
MVQKHYNDELIPKGTLFGWSPDLKGIYQDKRLNHINIDRLLKQSIEKALVKKGFQFAKNTIAVGYTAALKSSLNDDEVLQIFGTHLGWFLVANWILTWKKEL